MTSYEDLSGALSDEVLTDMADNFFGDRVRLEENIKLLHKTADLLRKKEAGIYERAAFLNYLMDNREAARAVYRASGIDSDVFMVESAVPVHVLPAYMPSAFTQKGEYVKIVLWAYEALESACRNYGQGMKTARPEHRRFEVLDADVLLLKGMCTLINEEIDRINHRCLPSQILQAAKNFDPAAQVKEHFTGGGTYYGDECTLNENLAFKPIEFSSIGIRELPEPLPLDNVRDDIVREARANYGRHKDRIHDILSQVRHMCRSSAET